MLTLAIVGMSVGLLRSDAAADARTLHAVGAGRRTRRSITAGTAGALPLLAVLIGTTTDLALVAGHRSDLARLGDPPLVHLCDLAIGLPAVAAAGGWLLGGRESP